MQVYIINQEAAVVSVEVYLNCRRLCLERRFVENSTNVNVMIESKGKMLEACDVAYFVIDELGSYLITVDKVVIED